MDEVRIVDVVSIRTAGFDEYWLRDRIFDDPTILGLGELQAVTKEKSQSHGGRLDLLLKNPEDDSMYEVELQLGPTDESHIIRTIEYWEVEKRRWPRRSHTAVLVAEEITSRFFNVVQLLSMAVPIIGVQANMVQVGDVKALHFTKIIDSYEEPEEEETSPQYDEKHWADNYPGTLDCARWYRTLLEKLYGDIQTKYFDSYISLTLAGTARVWIQKRKGGRAFIDLKHGEDGFAEAKDWLDTRGVAFGFRDGKYLTFNVSLQQLRDNAETHEWLAARLSPGDLKKST